MFNSSFYEMLSIAITPNLLYLPDNQGRNELKKLDGEQTKIPERWLSI